MPVPGPMLLPPSTRLRDAARDSCPAVCPPTGILVASIRQATLQHAATASLSHTRAEPRIGCNHRQSGACSVRQLARSSALGAVMHSPVSQKLPLTSEHTSGGGTHGACASAWVASQPHPHVRHQGLPLTAPSGAAYADAVQRCRAAVAAAGALPRRAADPGARFRNRVRSRMRFAALRHWLLATFGAAALVAGSGIADIGGGGGDVAFELCNAARVPATIVDPRQPCMWKCVKKLSVRPAC